MASSADYIRDLTGLGYTFRYNEASDRVEVNGEAITDVIQSEIRSRMRDLRHKHMTAMEDAYLAHAWANRYHPVKDYLRGLVWDGGSHIAAVAGHFTDRHGVFGAYLRRWLIGAVAKVFDVEARNVMLVLDSRQRLGKSLFVRWLCPPALRAYFHEGPLNVDDKDTWARLTSTFIWELSELDATTKRADRAALKDFITRHEVTIRRPYARFDTTRPALASLIGTINEEGAGFLNDPTGSTRFAVVSLTAIDWQGYSRIAIDQVWAEAFTAYQAGEPWEFTDTEFAAQEAINEEYEVDAPVEALLRRYYDIDPAGADWTPAIEIIQELEVMGLKDSQRASLMELARIMKKAGVEKQRIRRVWSYRGVTRRTGAGLP